MLRPRLKEQYTREITPRLVKQFGYKSVMQVPRLEKICINQGLGSAVLNKKLIEVGIDELTAIAGQKAVATMAKKSISNFKLRSGMAIGVKVTLRGARMYEFLDRLVAIALPRIRNFSGLSLNGFDGQGNYNLGIREQVIFPEIDMNQVMKMNGLNMTFVTNSSRVEESLALLRALGMPFQDK